MDLFADIIVSLLPVMTVCRLAASKACSCIEVPGVDIVLVCRPSHVGICAMSSLDENRQ